VYNGDISPFMKEKEPFNRAGSFYLYFRNVLLSQTIEYGDISFRRFWVAGTGQVTEGKRGMVKHF